MMRAAKWAREHPKVSCPKAQEGVGAGGEHMAPVETFVATEKLTKWILLDPREGWPFRGATRVNVGIFQVCLRGGLDLLTLIEHLGRSTFPGRLGAVLAERSSPDQGFRPRSSRRSSRSRRALSICVVKASAFQGALFTGPARDTHVTRNATTCEEVGPQVPQFRVSVEVELETL